MRAVRFSLLGRVEVRQPDGSVLHLPSRKALALLTYLAMRRGEFQPRDKLAALLWGRHTARESPSQPTTGAIRGALDGIPPPPTLVERGDTVAVDATLVDVDVSRFELLVASEDLQSLTAAMLLYGGDFAEGLPASEPPFEEWLLTERGRLREQAIEGFARLLAHQTRSGDVNQAIQTAIRRLGLDPFLESVHRALMRLYTNQGRRGAALRQYHTCLALLRQELGADPSLKHGRYIVTCCSGNHRAFEWTLSTRRRCGKTPVPRRRRSRLIGRTAELALLRPARERALTGPGRARAHEEVMGEARRTGARVPLARAYEGEQLSFSPWVDALRAGGLVAYARQADAFTEGWRVELARLFPELGPTSPSPPRSQDPVRLFDAIAMLLRVVAHQQPLVVVLEDLRWADELSIRLLAFLGRRLGEATVFLVGSDRSEELHHGDALRRALGTCLPSFVTPIVVAKSLSPVYGESRSQRRPRRGRRQPSQQCAGVLVRA